MKTKLHLAILCTPITMVFLVWAITPPVWKLDDSPLAAPGTVTSQTYGPSSQNWVSLDRISKHLINAILVAEDARFYNHDGLDFTEIANSFWQNLRAQKIVRGGSTITQQVVKIVFLTPERTLLRKLREATGAVLMEYWFSKETILEWYLNIVEFGDGISGVGPASQYYFKNRPDKLTIQQAVNLAIVLPSPNVRSRGLKQARLTEFGHRRFHQVVQGMFENGFINKKLRKNALMSGDFGRKIQYANLAEAPKTRKKKSKDLDTIILTSPFQAEQFMPNFSRLPAAD